MSELTKKRRATSGHRAYVIKQLARVKELTEDLSANNTTALNQLKISLADKIETISRLDEQILESIEEDEDIDREIEEASNVKSEIYGGIAAIDEVLAWPETSRIPPRNGGSLSTESKFFSARETAEAGNEDVQWEDPRVD